MFHHRSMELGGAEIVLLTILKYLDRNKFEIALLLNFERGEFLKRIPNDVKVISKAGKIAGKNIFEKVMGRLRLFKFENDRLGFYKRHQLAKVDVEVAFTNYMFENVLKSPLKNTKKVFWFHGDLSRFDLTEEQKKAMVAQMQEFDQGVFVSRHAKEIIERTWEVKLKNSVVINNPLDVKDILKKVSEKPEKDFGKVNFLSVGRLAKGKRFDNLLNAHSRLIGEGYDVKTLILGEGSERGHLEELIKENNLQKSFLLGGFMQNPYPYFKTADYFVLSSAHEGYSLVVAEAVLLGLPVIATKVGAVPEMVSPQNGVVVEPGSENLYVAMKQMLNSKPENQENQIGKEIEENDKAINDIENLLGNL